MESPCAHNAVMWRPRWGVPVLLVSACGAPAAAPPPNPAAQAAQAAGTFEVERADPASALVEIAYVVAACTVLKDLGLVEEADRVVISLDLGGREGKDCTEPVRKHRTVRLAAPLGERAVYDGAVSPPFRLR